MMAYQNTMDVYDAIEVLSNQMLDAAKKEEWDALSDLESICAQHVQQLCNTPWGCYKKLH